MDTRQSFYLAPAQGDFAEPARDASRLVSDIPHVTAANDNVPVKERLSERCRALLRRLIGLLAAAKAREETDPLNHEASNPRRIAAIE